MKFRASVTFILVAAITCAAHAAAPVPDDDLPPRPNYLSPAAATATDITAPLATPAEEQAYHKANDFLLNDNDALAPKERGDLRLLLEKRAKVADTDGERRLLMLTVFREALRCAPSPTDLDACAQDALGVLDGPTIALTAQRIAILTDANRLMPQNEKYAPAVIADEIFTLAELHFDAGLFDDAAKDLQAARKWTDRDADYSAAMRESIDRFTAELQRETALEKTLAAKPNDPAANTAKGLALLARSTNPADVAPFLAQSTQPEFQNLAKTLAHPPNNAADNFAIAQAADAAMLIAAPSDQMTLAFLIRREAHLAADNPHVSKDDQAGAQQWLAHIASTLATVKLPPQNINAPTATLFGLQTKGHTIIFILDQSGSMLDNFDFLRQEAIHSVNNLKAYQRINVVMVSEVATTIFSRDPRPATAETKKEFASKIGEFRAQGFNEDLIIPFKEAFEKAFAMKPNAIFFLTDGHFDPRLIEVVAKLNHDHKVHVNTLAFINKEPSYEDQLKKMAKANDGNYKFVTEKDLGQ